MAHWLDDYLPLRIMHKQIPAEVYNRIRVGLLRERLPWRLSLPRLRCLACILDEQAWVCMDECQDGPPIMAWTAFKIAERDALDAPIECELRLYHMHAGLVMGRALEALCDAVAEHARLSPHTDLPVSVLRT